MARSDGRGSNSEGLIGSVGEPEPSRWSVVKVNGANHREGQVVSGGPQELAV